MGRRWCKTHHVLAVTCLQSNSRCENLKCVWSKYSVCFYVRNTLRCTEDTVCFCLEIRDGFVMLLDVSSEVYTLSTCCSSYLFYIPCLTYRNKSTKVACSTSETADVDDVLKT